MEIASLDKCSAPLSLWCKLIGIPLMISDKSKKNPTLITVYGVLLFLVTIGNSIATIFWAIQRLQESQRNDKRKDHVTSTFMWGFSIEIFNQIFINAGAQLGLLVSSFTSWPGLIEIFSKIKDEHNFLTVREYHRIRKICKIGLTILLLDRTIYQMIMISKWFQMELSLSLGLITVLGAFETIYPISSYVLFICFGYISILMIEALSNHITHNRGIECCKGRYLIICQWIHQLNCCFGFILLVLISGGFIRMISTSFFLVSEFKRSGILSTDFFIATWILLHEFCAIFATAYVSRQVQIETKRMIICCLRWSQSQLNDSILQTKIDLFAVEISNTQPHFTAMGLFDVDLKLIPKVIGTTLTYLIILFQFQTSEKEIPN